MRKKFTIETPWPFNNFLTDEIIEKLDIILFEYDMSTSDFDMEQLIEIFFAYKHNLDFEDMLNPNYSPEEMRSIRKSILHKILEHQYYPKLSYNKQLIGLR